MLHFLRLSGMCVLGGERNVMFFYQQHQNKLKSFQQVHLSQCFYFVCVCVCVFAVYQYNVTGLAVKVDQGLPYKHHHYLRLSGEPL